MDPEDRSTSDESDPADGDDPARDPTDVDDAVRPNDSAASDDSTPSRDLTSRRDPARRDDPNHGDGTDRSDGPVGPSGEDGPNDRTGTDRTPGSGGDERGVLYRFRHDMEGPFMWVREVLTSFAIVLLIGLVLFAVSGAWPPMVAVESGSMEPNMEVGDLVFVTEPGRFAPDAATNEVGVVTHEVGREVDYRTFNDHGSVIIYRPPGRQSSPIIHRAMFHVEEGENWYERADDRFHNAESCDDLRHCPAPRDGFITLGDNNRQYDQANGLAEPVAADWVTGVARARVPYLGYVRLITTGQVKLSDVLTTTRTGPVRDPEPSWTVNSVGPSVGADPASTSMPTSPSPSQLSNRA